MSRISLQVNNYFCLTKAIILIANISKLVETFNNSLRENCPNMEFSGPYLSVFSPNAGKYGPEKTPHLDIFHV